MEKILYKFPLLFASVLLYSYENKYRGHVKKITNQTKPRSRLHTFKRKKYVWLCMWLLWPQGKMPVYSQCLAPLLAWSSTWIIFNHKLIWLKKIKSRNTFCDEKMLFLLKCSKNMLIFMTNSSRRNERMILLSIKHFGQEFWCLASYVFLILFN